MRHSGEGFSLLYLCIIGRTKTYGPETGPQKSAARSAAEGQLTIHRTMEDLEKNLTPEQAREILAGILDGRITVEVARQLVKGAL